MTKMTDDQRVIGAWHDNNSRSDENLALNNGLGLNNTALEYKGWITNQE